MLKRIFCTIVLLFIFVSIGTAQKYKVPVERVRIFNLTQEQDIYDFMAKSNGIAEWRENLIKVCAANNGELHSFFVKPETKFWFGWLRNSWDTNFRGEYDRFGVLGYESIECR